MKETKNIQNCGRAFLRFLMLPALLTCTVFVHAQERLVGMGQDNDSVAFSEIVALGLPVIDISTVGGEWPTCDYVSAPFGYFGVSITNATKVPGRLRIVESSGITYDSGEFLEEVRGMTLRIRGNSSAYKSKKPYKIDLQEKADLLNRHNPSFRDKDWLLITDEKLMAFVGYELGRLMQMPWTPGYQYVNVVINDEYQGFYMLIESVKRNNNCRIDVTKNGFIFESDAYWWNQDFYIPSLMMPLMNYTFKYPSPDNMTQGDIDYVTAYINAYEQSVTDGTYPQYIDVASFARWCLAHDILGTWDSGGANRYFTKYDRSAGSKLTIPCLWDFDSSERDPELFSRCHRLLYPEFFGNKNREFVETYIAMWQRLSPSIAKNMQTKSDQFRSSEQGKALAKSYPYNTIRWKITGSVQNLMMARMKWIRERTAWLNNAIDELSPASDVNNDGIVDVTDVSILIDVVLGKDNAEKYHGRADINSDGRIDISDVNALIDIILSSFSNNQKNIFRNR